MNKKKTDIGKDHSHRPDRGYDSYIFNFGNLVSVIKISGRAGSRVHHVDEESPAPQGRMPDNVRRR